MCIQTQKRGRNESIRTQKLCFLVCLINYMGSWIFGWIVEFNPRWYELWFVILITLLWRMINLEENWVRVIRFVAYIMMGGARFQGVRRGLRVFAVFGDESGSVERKSTWGTIFDVEDPRSKFPQSKGKFLDVNQALEVARFDIQYCDWRARQDLLTIMLLHEKVPSCFLSSILFTSFYLIF